MGGSVVEPQSDEEKQRIKERKDTMFLDNTVLSTCPTNILPATLKVSVGEVPIVNCISHEICTRHKTHGRSSQWDVYSSLRCCAAHVLTFRMIHCIIPKK